LLALLALISTSPRVFPAQTLTASDQRAGAAKDLNTPRTFPKIESRTEWEARAKEIRENTLVSCGLWPLPEKTPLDAHVFGKVERDGYRIEKVYFQTYPGFYLAGNLYRPLGKGDGPFPAILNPHGHWAHGRIGRRHADVYPRRGGRPAGGAGADRDGVALNAGRLLVRECARIARRLFEHGNRRRARAAPADFRRRHG